ncbi:MAG TPA: FliA/WhiG family RNA polymerase sigma factor [Longimicrobiaceae bacterium]|nr:FliA/WhiG family RNA polymerase sigma factor [Longimicrobiaceae bacterium]
MNTSTALWESYSHDADPVARDRLLNEHLGLVHHVARQMSRSLAADVDFDELISSGTVGLMNALDSFDASRGLAFSTFAAPRIRGAILDELRRQDHVPRSIRRKSREIGAARESLTRSLGYAPDDRTLAEHMGIELDTLWRWQSEIEGIFHMPLDRPSGDDDNRAAPADSLPGATGQKIEDELNLQQEVDVLRDAILRLKEQERVVLSLYYFEELKLHEIATILELTESRVSQIRSKAISKLRAEMAPLREQVA